MTCSSAMLLRSKASKKCVCGSVLCVAVYCKCVAVYCSMLLRVVAELNAVRQRHVAEIQGL